MKIHLLVNLFLLKLWIKLKYNQFLLAITDEAEININLLAIVPTIDIFIYMTFYQIIGFSTASLIHKYLDLNSSNLL